MPEDNDQTNNTIESRLEDVEAELKAQQILEEIERQQQSTSAPVLDLSGKNNSENN